MWRFLILVSPTHPRVCVRPHAGVWAVCGLDAAGGECRVNSLRHRAGAATPPSRGRLCPVPKLTGRASAALSGRQRRSAATTKRLPLEGAGSRLRLTEGVIGIIAALCIPPHPIPPDMNYSKSPLILPKQYVIIPLTSMLRFLRAGRCRACGQEGK